MTVEQREKPEHQATLAVLRSAHPDGMVSGAQFENFREGWAARAMPYSEIGHYFKRVAFDQARAKCGFRAEVRWLYGVGNFPKCARCLQAVNRRGRS